MFRLRKGMATITIFALSLAMSVNFTDRAAAAIATQNQTDPKASGVFKQREITFEKNDGQTDRKAKFISRARGFNLYLAENEVVFQLNRKTEIAPETGVAKTASTTASDIVRMSFIGANTEPKITGEHETVTKTNYYTGRTRLENVPNFGRVNYERLYDGIDAVFYGNAAKQLEYDFNVAPNADASQIKLDFTGAESVKIDEAGNLVVKTENSELVQNKPFAYQVIGGEKREVTAEYVLNEQSHITNRKSQIHFSLGDYDRSLPLVIDPVVDYLTYVGGNDFDSLSGLATDSAGNIYVSGVTSSLDFPVNGAVAGNESAAFASKISPDGSTVLYTTILDGGDHDGISGFDIGFTGNKIAVDASGNAFVTGMTDSEDFPVSQNAYQKVRLCSRQFGSCIFPEEVFVTKLNAQGAMVYSTYVGGRNTDFANGIAVDSAGRAYITGGTLSGITFPTKNQFQGTGIFGTAGSFDAFLTVLNASGSDILYSTGLGGGEDDLASAIAIDSSNNVYITGETDESNNFPTKNAFQISHGGRADVFVAKFDTTKSGNASLLYSTLIGGAGTDNGNGIAVDQSGQAYVVGVTGSSNFPLVNPIRSTNQVNEAFVAVLSASGSALQNSTFVGGAGQETATDVALDSTGSIYVTGNTSSSDFPLALPFQNTIGGERDAFVLKLKFGRGIISSSFLGGALFDSGQEIAVRGNHIFLGGATNSSDLPTTAGTLQPAFGGQNDGFLAKILDTKLEAVGVFRSPTTFSLTQSIVNVVPVTPNFTSLIAGQRGVSGDWDGDGIDSIGSFTNGTWKVRNVNFPLANIPAIFGGKTITFGQAGDLPVTGDWNNDGIDTPGVYRPSAGQFLLTNSTSTTPTVDLTINFGIAEDLPVSGDWNADGFDSVGIFRPSTGQFFLTDDNVAVPTIDQAFFFGTAGDLPVGGDWNGDGVVTIGVYRPSTTEFFLTNDNINFSNVFTFGNIGDQPIVGDWDGRPLP